MACARRADRSALASKVVTGVGSLTVRDRVRSRHHRTVLRGGAVFPALFVAPVAAHWLPHAVMLWREGFVFCLSTHLRSAS